MLNKGKIELQVNIQFSLKFQRTTTKTFNLLHELWCTNLKHLVIHTTQFCTDEPNICIIISVFFTYKNAYQVTCLKQKALDMSIW